MAAFLDTVIEILFNCASEKMDMGMTEMVCYGKVLKVSTKEALFYT